MARYRRTLEDSLKDIAGSARASSTVLLATPEMQELGQEYIAADSIGTEQLIANAVTADILADSAVGRGSFDQELSDTVDDLVHGVSRIDDEILPAINDAYASPVTDSRLVEGSLTKWPFVGGSIPAGALAPGAIGNANIADFAIAVTKLKDDRHHVY